MPADSAGGGRGGSGIGGGGWRWLAAYGALGLPLAALNLPLYVFVPAFYAEKLGVGMAAIGFALLVARLFDAVIDPVVGEIGDRLRSRVERRTWLYAATPALLFATWMLFVPSEGAGAAYLLAWTCIAYLGWTAMLLPYTAMGAELTDDTDERSRLAAVREACVVAGIIVAAALPSVTGESEGAAKGRSLELLFWIMLVLLPLALVLLRFGVPERTVAEPAEKLSWRRSLQLLATDRPFLRLLTAFLLNGIANGLPATLFLLYVTNVIADPAAAGPLLLLYFVAGIVAIPFWLRLSYRIGKHKAWSASMLWACVMFAIVPFLGPGDTIAFGVICVLSGLGLGADLALPASIQADIIDRDRQRSGRWRSGLYMALWSMATKLALALAVGVSFPLLQAAGFNAEGTNDPQALRVLSWLYGLAPVAIKLVATALVWRFELQPTRHAAQA